MPEELDPNWEYWEGDPEIIDLLNEEAETDRGVFDLIAVGCYTPGPQAVRGRPARVKEREGIAHLYVFNCAVCGKRKWSKHEGARFCSRTCSGDWRMKELRERGLLIKRCPTCQKVFTLPDSHLFRRRMYCGYDCNPSYSYKTVRRAPVPLSLLLNEAKLLIFKGLPFEDVDPLVENEHREELRKWFVESGVSRMATAQRDHLPTRRRSVTQKVRVGNQSLYYTIGLYPDGRPGELFIDVAKAGAALRTWAGETGMMFSIALQHGTPLETILDLFIGARSDPSGPVEGHPRIKTCLSIMDLIARDVAITFLQREDLADVGDWEVPPVPVSDHFIRTAIPDGVKCQCHSDKTTPVKKE